NRQDADLSFQSGGDADYYEIYVVYKDGSISYTSCPAGEAKTGRAQGDAVTKPDFVYEDSFTTDKNLALAVRSHGCTWTAGAGGSLACQNGEVIYKFDFPAPISVIKMEGLIPEKCNYLFRGDGNHQAIYIDFSRDGSKWLAAYEYEWAIDEGLKPV